MVSAGLTGPFAIQKRSVLSRGLGEDLVDACKRHIAGLQSTNQPGNSTVSITWMTPFDCMTLRMVT
jgi:hypothetical protein